MWKKRVLKNYQPDRKQAKVLMIKKLKPFLLIISLILVLEIIGYLILWKIESKDEIKKMAIPLVCLHLLATVTYVWILDLGPANKLRKDNFKVEGSNVTDKQNQTFYAALRYIGFSRFIINNICTWINIIIVLIVFCI